jgi:hypothetical protein
MEPFYIIIKPMKNLSLLYNSTLLLRNKINIAHKASALSLTFNCKNNVGFTRFVHFTKKTKLCTSVNKPVLIYKSPCMKNRYISPLVLDRNFSISSILYTSDDEIMSNSSNLSEISNDAYNSDSSDLEGKLNKTIEQKDHHMKEASHTREEFREEHSD